MVTLYILVCGTYSLEFCDESPESFIGACLVHYDKQSRYIGVQATMI